MKLPSSIDTILFDLDNTLIDRDCAMKEAVRHWLKHQGTVSETAMNKELERILEKDNSGYTDRQFFCEWLSDNYGNDDTKTAKSYKEVLRDLQELTISYLQPDAGILDILQQLEQQYLLGIATNGSQYVQQKKIAKTKLDTTFLTNQIYISETLGHQKPDPGFYHKILQTIGKNPEQCLMVGDNYVNDIEGARHCGLYTCWIDHRRSSEKGPADTTFNEMTEVLQWLRA